MKGAIAEKFLALVIGPRDVYSSISIENFPAVLISYEIDF
jgi:hypothetical protein